MAREISISFALNAALGGGFKGAFQTAAQSARNVASAIRDMEKTPVGKIGASMAAQGEKIRGLSGSLKEAKSTLATLQAQAQASGGATVMLARQIEMAQSRVNNLNGAMQRQLGQYKQTAAQAATTGGSVRRLTQEYNNLTHQIERTRRVQGAMAANRAQADALRNQRADLNGRLSGAMATAATVAVPAKLSIDFEQSIANVGAVANASDADLAKLTATARQLGRDTMFSASQAAEGMKYLAMAGFNTEQTIAAMPGMLDLAAAANTDLGTTADIASDILTAFNMKASEIGDVGNILTRAFTSSNTDLSMLGETMKYVAPVAASLGMTLDQTAAYAGAMANAGVKASQGGTVLRAAMLRLAAPPKASRETLAEMTGLEGEELDKLQDELGDGAKALAELGMTTKDEAGNLRPMVDILEELNMRTAKMGNAEKAEVFKNIFGTEASAGMIALADQAAKTVDDKGNAIVDSAGRQTNALRKMLETTTNQDITAAKVAKKQLDTTQGSLRLLSSAWEDAGISVGNLFLPAIRTAAGMLSTVANAISGFTERFPTLSKYVAIAVGGFMALTVGGVFLGLVLNTVKTGLNGIGGGLLRMAASQTVATATSTAFGAASTAAGAGARFFAGGLRAILTATGVGAVLVALGFAVSLLIDHWDEVVAAMSSAWNWVTTTWSQLGVFFTELGNNLSAIFPALGAIISDPFVWAKETVVNVWTGVTEFFSGLWSGIATTASGIWQGVVGMVTWARDSIVGVWTGISEWISAVWQSVVDNAGFAFEGVAAIWNGAVEFFGGIVDSIFGVFTGLFDWLKEKFAWVFSTIDAVSSVVGSITGAVKGAWNKAFGDGKEGGDAAKESAPAASAASEKPAAPAAAASTEKPAVTAKAPPQFKPVSAAAVKAQNPESEKKGRSGSKGGAKRSGGGGGRKSAGGSAGSGGAGSAASGAMSGSGPTTIVKVGGDNKTTQTIFIPAGANKPGNAAGAAQKASNSPISIGAGKTGISRGSQETAAPISAGTGTSGMATIPVGAGTSGMALPQTPGMISGKQGGRQKATQSPSSIQVDLTQNFDLISGDAAAMRKVMESLKPDFEALVRKALAKMQSDHSRTAYAQ